MTMKKSFIYSLAAVFALAACTKEADVKVPTGETVTIIASVDQTRSTESHASFSWVAGEEQISVGTSDEEYVTFDVTNADDGIFQHTFSGETPQLLVAVSPVQENAEFVDDGSYEVVLPAVYNNYDPSKGVTNALMIGTPDPSVANKFLFRHAAALLKITYANVPVGVSYFRFKADTKIAGSIIIEGTDVSAIEIANTNDQFNDDYASDEVYINLATPVSAANTSLTFYVPVPTGDYSRFEIALGNTQGDIAATLKVMDRTNKSALTLARGDVFNFPTITLTPQANTYTKVTTEPSDWTGTYLIVFEGATVSGNEVPAVAYNGSLENLDATPNGIAVTIENGQITGNSTLDAAVFSIEAVEGGYSIQAVGNTQYVGRSADSNGLDIDPDPIVNSISLNASGSVDIISGGAYMRYNANSGQYKFRYFKSSTYTNQKPVYLYLLAGSNTPDERTEVTLTFNPANPTAITLGETFAKPELTVNPVAAASSVVYTVESEPANCAIIDAATGDLTISAAGTITVTAAIPAGNATYKPVSASYTLTVNPVATIDFQTIAELNALIAEDKPSESNPATYSGKLTNAVVSYVPTPKNAIIKDATGSVLVYNNDGHNLIQGQTFTGDMTVTAILYRNCSEILAIDAAFVGDGAVVNPEVVTLEDLVGHLETYQNAYVQLSGLTVTAVDGKNVTVTDDEDRTYIVYSSAANASCVVGDVITVVGTVAWYNDKDQVKAWKATDITVTYHPVASRTITFTQPSQSGCSIAVSVDGSSITSGDGVPEGKTVTIAATGTNDYVFTKWTVTGATVANATASTTTFVVGGNNVTISAEFSDPNKDVLNFDFTGNTGTSYSSWSNKTGVSGAVYAGQSGGNHSSIQLRSDNSNSGIITTSSSKYAKKVIVTWNSNTPTGRTLQVYGKNTAYSNPTDLYGGNAGALIGTIVCGTSTELTINYDYKYIGLRSSSGTIYLDEIQIDWSASASGNVQKFDVVLADSQNGEVTAQPSEDIEPGTQVVLTITPDDDYELSTLIVDGKNVTSSVSNGAYTFNMPYHDVNVSAAFAAVQTGEESHAQFIFNTDEGLSALGITKPALGGSTDLVGPYALDGVTLSVTHASTKTRVYNSSGTLELRVYKNGGSLSFAVENGKKIISIAITGTAPFSANVGTFSNGNWTGNAQSVTLSATNTAKINTITVTYK